MSITVSDLLIRVRADMDQAKAGLAEVSGSLGGMSAIGLAAGVGIAAGVAVAGVALTRMAGDFQSGMTTLVTGAGEAEANLGMVSKGILQMAVDTGTSTAQLTAGMYMIESAGFHGAAGLKILQAAAEGAKVGNADLGTVADATTTILKDFANTGITANQAVNALITT
ncbi:MAG TPA: phage tail tape measure protein, partial [Ktedonobacterales bacterium]|nr:phage tail tape measure protein [Ktedonobacterales bacterium]